MLIVRSPVRISFAGGGTDMPAYYEKYGGAVLSTSINKYVYSIMRTRTDGKIQVISSDLRVTENWPNIERLPLRDSELQIPLAVLKEIGRRISVDLFLASEIMAGTGLGSSASACVGVLKTLATYLDLPFSKHQLAERAFHIGRNILNNPIGKQDEYAAAFGGLNYITFHRDGTTLVEPVVLRRDLLREFQSSLMLFFTGAAHNSWKLLKEQEHSVKHASGGAIDSLHQIRGLADAMRKALLSGELEFFGRMLHAGWEAKKKMSQAISNSVIDQAYGLAMKQGALGGKIAGAGGGGFLLVFCREQHQDNVRRALADIGIREMAFEFDLDGAQVIVNDPFVDGDERCGMRWVFSPISASNFEPVHLGGYVSHEQERIS
jgi:D-glycero-alpha-D-manno-heptose-7-phosphate kinase